MAAVPEMFVRLVGSSEPTTCRLVVANRTRSAPVQRLFEAAFDGQPVDVDDVEFPTDDTDLVALVRDGAVVATSSLTEVMDSFLLVNSDRYTTGGVDADTLELPAVLTNLDETRFEVRGYPHTDKAKFLLVAISRSIEARALDVGAGTFRATFQDLSRIADEVGTRRVYRRLGETDLDVHVYGVRGDVPSDVRATVHTGDHGGYRRAWCVVYTPPAPETGHAAVVALERDAGGWVGRWTYSLEHVQRLEATFVDEF
jgi:hypothetical protein